MLKMTLLVTLRNLRKDSTYVLINLSGLILGITCFLLLANYLRTQLSYDRHFEGYQHIYRLADRLHSEDGNIAHRAKVSRELAEILERDYPEFTDTLRLSPIDNTNSSAQAIRHGDTQFYWDNVYYADANIFDFFSHSIVYGDPATALAQPSSIAISQRLAETYFGDANPLGETFETDFGNYVITLVYADLPVNTHFKYQALVPFQNFINSQPTENYSRALWFVNAFTYVKLADAHDPKRIEAITWELYKRYMAEGGLRIGKQRSFYLEPLADIHLHSIVAGDQVRGNKFALLASAALGIFVLAIAGINAMNMAIARALKRANEVGLRKLLGADSRQLLGHFLTEAWLLTFTALLFALILVSFVIEQAWFTSLMGSARTLSLLQEPQLIAPILCFGLVLGLIIGLYPALYLSRIKPVSALSNSGRTGSGGDKGWVQRALVVMQFTFSIAIISCTWLMASQIQFLNNQPMGFNSEHLLIAKLRGAEAIRKVPTLKTILGNHPQIVGAAASLKVPGIDPAVFFGIQVDDGAGNLVSQSISAAYVGVDYLPLMGINIVEGRPFDESTLEYERILINETFARRLGDVNSVLNKRVVIGGNVEARIMGVVKDFHFQSLHEPMQSLILRRIQPGGFNPVNNQITASLSIRLTGNDIENTLDFINSTLTELDPDHLPELQFYEDALREIYGQEANLMSVVALLALLCVFISCMGLFGLSAYTTARRSKEIGIRKILGASSNTLLTMLFKDILPLISVATVLAAFAAYYSMDQWLANFAIRIDINVLIFLITGALAALLAFLTLMLQGNQIVRRNPIHSLRGS